MPIEFSSFISELYKKKTAELEDGLDALSEEAKWLEKLSDLSPSADELELLPIHLYPLYDQYMAKASLYRAINEENQLDEKERHDFLLQAVAFGSFSAAYLLLSSYISKADESIKDSIIENFSYPIGITHQVIHYQPFSPSYLLYAHECRFCAHLHIYEEDFLAAFSWFKQAYIALQLAKNLWEDSHVMLKMFKDHDFKEFFGFESFDQALGEVKDKLYELNPTGLELAELNKIALEWQEEIASKLINKSKQEEASIDKETAESFTSNQL